MSHISPFPERLQGAFRPAPGGVVGLVDNLLGLCREQGLQLNWHTNRCRVRSIGVEPEESTDVPLSKSVFRAILARLAALCNERAPKSVSPYGGQGELSIGVNPPTVFRVAFINTPDEQRLEVKRIGENKAESTKPQELVLATLRQWLQSPPDEDGCIRELLSLGSETVAVIRNPANWRDFEPLIDWDAVADALLILCGAPLAQHWLLSLRPLLASRANKWLRANWPKCWDSLNDAIKRYLVEYFAKQAALNEARARGNEELPKMIAAALSRFKE